MRKIRFSLVLAFAATAALSAATVAPVSNFVCGTRPRLIPEVHEYRAQPGVFPLPRLLTVELPAAESLIVEQLDAEMRRFGGSARTAADGERAICRFVLAKQGVPEHGQGYTLTVAAGGITVAARTADGLFYGAQTLRNLLRNAHAPELKACLITDFPSIDRRGYTFSLRYVKPERLPVVKRLIDTFAALKLNWLLIDLGEAFPYRNNPYTKRRNAYSADELKDLLDFCRRRHIEVSPALQVWSHAQWMTAHPRWDEMKEGVPSRDWMSQPCPENAEARRLTAEAIREQLDFFRPRAFMIDLDELYLGPFGVCPKCKGKNHEEQFARIIGEAEKLLLDRGVTPIVCHDSFEDRPGLRWPFGSRLLRRLDRRTNILWWKYDDVLPEDNLLRFLDFKVIGHSIVGKPLNTYNMAKLVRKHGSRECIMVHWYYSNSSGMLSDLDRETPENLGGLVNSADYLWNLRDIHYSALGYDGVQEFLRLAYPEKVTVFPRPDRALPVPLDRFVNAELSTSGRFPRFVGDAEVAEVRRVLAELPENFRLITSGGGKYYGLRVAGDRGKTGRNGILIPLGDRRIRELAFLLTATRSRDPLAFAGGRLYGSKRFRRPKVGTLRFRYADGTEEERPLLYRETISDWNLPFGGSGMRFAVRGTDADGNFFSFGVLDFINPHPDKPLHSVTLATTRTEGISPVLLALSARSVDRPFEAVPPFRPDDLAGRVGVDEAAAPKLHVVADFENGMGPVTVSAPDSVKAAMKVDIVDDPDSPSHSKVLRIIVPPGKYAGRKSDLGLLRISVDLPYRLAPGAAARGLDFKVTAGKGFSHANDYLLDSDPPSENSKLRSKRFLGPYGIERADGKWRRLLLPFWLRDQSGARKMKNPADTRYRRVSFFFRSIDEPAEIRVDNLCDAGKGLSFLPPWSVDHEYDLMPD